MAGALPKTIGRYEVERLLGVGAMGAVYLAKDPSLGRLVAVKTVRAQDLDEQTLARYLERFRNEARAAGRLHHPAIVQVFDVGEDDACGPYLVFEYVAGASLASVLRAQGRLAPARVLSVASDVAGALEVAHEAGIVHRDIKPDNLLVTEDGRVKLADFGIARVPDAALTKDGQFLGTPCYAAPEALRSGTYNPTSDVFSFAAVLYELITGVRAFPGTDAVAVAHKVAHEEPLRPSLAVKEVAVPDAVDRVIMKGLAKDPKDRYPRAEALRAALAAALEEAGVAVERSGAQRAGAPGSLAVVGVVAAALAVGLGAIVAFGGGASGGVSAVDAGAPEASEPPAHPPPPSRDGAAGATAPSDAAAPAQDGGAALRDGGTVEPASGAPEAATAHDREEAAKDELERAERLFAAGQLDEAKTAVERARKLDPSNTDVGRLLERLGTAPAAP